MRPAVRMLVAVVAAAAVLGAAGCKQIASLGVMLSPPQMQKAEFDLTKGHLVILVDHANASQANPVFDLTLHNRIVQLFGENKVSSQVVPYDDVIRLRQTNPDFASWSLQKIGRALDADQVLSLRIRDLHLRGTHGDATLSPRVELTVKVVGVPEPGGKARLWPARDAEPDGRTITAERQPKEAESADLVDSEAAKLARETAVYVARLFYEYDTEQRFPREP